jgi:Na+-transporting NADH:ubiquinone oxidoreductase subunit B
MVNALFAFLTEWLFKRKTKKPVSEAVFVSAILYTLTLPPSTPYWVGAIGIIFGIFFGKEVFGGFGRNVFNPALVGRAFVYVSFPTFLTAQWVKPAQGLLGGFVKYATPQVDSLTFATPMIIYRSTGEITNYLSLFFGNISGSLGETSAILILISAIYLLIKKTVFWENMLGVIVGFSFMTILFNILGFSQVPPLMFGLLSGGLLFGTVFMITDPITSARTTEGKIIYGFIVGAVTVVIRGFALFAGGMMFAILVGNMFVPIIDEMVKSFKSTKKKVGAVDAK